MLLYADEDFAFPAVVFLRSWGHDAVTVQEDSLSGTPDSGVLARAHYLGRAILTYNRRDFERLHASGADHSGILSAKHDDDFRALAGRIHAALAGRKPGRWCIRVNRPPAPP